MRFVSIMVKTSIGYHCFPIVTERALNDSKLWNGGPAFVLMILYFMMYGSILLFNVTRVHVQQLQTIYFCCVCLSVYQSINTSNTIYGSQR